MIELSQWVFLNYKIILHCYIILNFPFFNDLYDFKSAYWKIFLIMCRKTPSYLCIWNVHQPISSPLRYSNWTLSRGFVKMSASCSFVSIFCILIVLLRTCLRKSSFRMPQIGMRSRILWLKAMYSALVVDSTILVCILLTQEIGHPEKVSTYPVLERTDDAKCKVWWQYAPAKSAYT